MPRGSQSQENRMATTIACGTAITTQANRAALSTPGDRQRTDAHSSCHPPST